MKSSRSACVVASALLAASASLVVCRADDSAAASTPCEPFPALVLAFRQQAHEDLPKHLRGQVFRLWLACEAKGIAQTSDSAPKDAIVFYHSPYSDRGGRLVFSNGDGTVRVGKESCALDDVPGRLGWVAGPTPEKPGEVALDGGPAFAKPHKDGTCAPVSTATTTTTPPTTDPKKPGSEPGQQDEGEPATNNTNPNNTSSNQQPNNGNNNNNGYQQPNNGNNNGYQQPNNGNNNNGYQQPNNGGGNNGGGNNGGGNNGGSPFGNNNGGNNNGGNANAGNNGSNGSATPAGPAAGYSPSGQGGTQDGGRKSSKGFIMLPSSGQGFIGYTADKGRWGVEKFVYGIERASRNYITDKYNQGASKVAVGDISLENGGPFAGHASHQKGVDADFALPRLDGGNSPRVNRFSAEYSQIGTQNQMNFLRKEVPVTMIFFNDPKIAGRQNWPNHDDHFHVRIQE